MMGKVTAMLQAYKKKYKELALPVKASVWFVICSVIQNGISFFVTPIFTRLMSTQQYGQVTVYTSWMGIICIFTTFNLQYGSFNTAQVKFEGRRDQYIASIQSLVTVTTLIAIGIYLLIPSFWNQLFRLPNGITVIMLIHILAQFVTGIWMGNKRFDFKYVPMIIVTTLSSFLIPLVGFIAVTNASEKGIARIISMACVEIVIAGVLYIHNLYKGKVLAKKEFWKYALSFNLPLIPYYLSQIIFNTSDRIMISKMVGDDKAGIYGLCYSVAFLLTFIINAVNNAFVPWLYRQIKKNDGTDVGSVVRKLIIGVAVMLILLILVAPELILFLGGKKYYEAIWIIPPVAASLLFSFYTDITCNIDFYYEEKKALVVATIVSALTNIGLNYIGIPVFGYYVSGYTTLISFILFWIMLYIGARRVCREHDMDEKQYIDFSFQLRFGIGFLIVASLIMITYMNPYIRYGLIFILLLLTVIFRKKLMGFVKSLMSFRGE